MSDANPQPDDDLENLREIYKRFHAGEFGEAKKQDAKLAHNFLLFIRDADEKEFPFVTPGMKKRAEKLFIEQSESGAFDVLDFGIEVNISPKRKAQLEAILDQMDAEEAEKKKAAENPLSLQGSLDFLQAEKPENQEKAGERKKQEDIKEKQDLSKAQQELLDNPNALFEREQTEQEKAEIDDALGPDFAKKIRNSTRKKKNRGG